MKFNYKLNRLCGSVYTEGTLVFTKDGFSLLSISSNRVTVFNLTTHESRTLEFEARSNIKLIALSHDNRFLIAIDTNDYVTLLNFERGVGERAKPALMKTSMRASERSETACKRASRN